MFQARIPVVANGLPPSGAAAILKVMAGRRYDDKEIAAIFRAAADGPEPRRREVPREEGLTLAELQAIGREVGIAPEAVAQAAHGLDVQRGAVSRTWFGLPIGVARSVDLNRRLSDLEWDRLVVQLRDVFNARGVTRSEGSLRQWTNGNLQVLLEPTETGHRLRFGTVNGAARASIRGGLFSLGIAAVLTISGIFAGNLDSQLPGIALLLLVSLGLFANGALRLPGWARLRGRQMEEVAARIASSAEHGNPG